MRVLSFFLFIFGSLSVANDLEGIDEYDCEFTKKLPMQLIRVERNLSTGEKVKYAYCNAHILCFKDKKFVGFVEVQTKPINGMCPSLENWPREKPEYSEHLKAELHPSATYEQVDKWGRECRYIYTDNSVHALYWKNDAAEEGWDTHCLNIVGCEASAKKGKEVRWAACPTVGYRVLADGYHKYPLCEGPVDCIKHSYPMDKAKLK